MYLAWIAIQESETLGTVRNQLSRIFDTEHGGTLSPHAQTFEVFQMHNRTVNSSYNVFLQPLVPFWGRNEIAPHLGVKSPPPKKNIFGRE